jgi:hypothetical protein
MAVMMPSVARHRKITICLNKEKEKGGAKFSPLRRLAEDRNHRGLDGLRRFAAEISNRTTSQFGCTELLLTLRLTANRLCGEN